MCIRDRYKAYRNYVLDYLKDIMNEKEFIVLHLSLIHIWTKNRSAKDIARDIDRLGGEINAFTNKECTCYYVHLLDEHIKKGIDLSLIHI